MRRFMDAGTIRHLCLALALLVLLPLPALAATIYVDADCTLAQAIESANATDATAQVETAIHKCEKGNISGADTIVLTDHVQSDGKLTVPEITTEIFIDARGRDFIGEGGNGFTFTAPDTNAKLTIDNARFTNAKPRDGEYGVVPISASGDVTFQNVEFFNSAGDTDGTGVRLEVTGGNVKVREGVFRDNRLDSGSVVSGDVDIYRSAFHDNHGTGDGYVISGGASIRSSTIGLNRDTGTGTDNYAVSGAVSLNNVTVAYNRGGGVTGAKRIRNSILYANSGHDCAGNPNVAFSWIGDSEGDNCKKGEGIRTGPSPDIDDDPSSGSNVIGIMFLLEDNADAAGIGQDCEFLDQRGRLFGPNPCDLGAHSRYVVGSGPRISAPAPTPLPTPTPVAPQPAPTIEPVQGWVLFSDRDDIKSNEVNEAGVGIAHIIEMGFLTAVDIWSEVGWGVTACHTDYSNGNFVFLDAAGMPRVAETWPAAPHIDGMACTYIETPGTIVLMRADPWQEPPTPTPDPNAPVFGPPTPVMLEDCQLITRDMVNLRVEEWGDVLNIIPYETELTASEASEEFFKVTFEEQEGWVHRDWVTITAGVCGAVEDEEEEA